MKKISIIFLLLLLLKGGSAQMLSYPETRTVDSADSYFGIKVNDPYRWLENDSSAETKDWVMAENKITRDYISKIPFRPLVKKALKDNYNYAKQSAPVKYGEWYYFFKNSGLQNQSVIYRMKNYSDTAKAEIFIDPNSFARDGAVSFQNFYFSPDFSLCAYLISNGGSDWREVIIKDVHTGNQVGDTIRNVKFSGVSWKGNDGFYYSTYEIPAGQNKLVAKSDHHTAYYHKLGTPQKEDEIVYGGSKQPFRYISAVVTEDQHFLVLSMAESTYGNELMIKNLSKNESPFLPIVTDLKSAQSVVDTKDGMLYIITDRNAPNQKLVKVNASAPGPENWKDVIPETTNTLEVGSGGGYFFATYMVDVKSQVFQFDYDGKKISEIILPTAGTASGFGCYNNEHEFFYTFRSFTYPNTVYHYDIDNGKSEFYSKPAVRFNPDDFVTKQVFYPSRDGTKIPMFIVYKKNIVPNGKNPTYLYAYGGFNASLTHHSPLFGWCGWKMGVSMRSRIYVAVVNMAKNGMRQGH